MSRRQRSRVKTKKGMWIVALVAIVLSVSMLTGRARLTKTSSALAVEQRRLHQQIDTEKEKKKELDNQETYMQTDEYIEEVAREKLGMVKDGEILFKARE